MNTQGKVVITWRSGEAENKPLATVLEALGKKLDKILFSYLEWRPGTGLLTPDAGPAPILIEGPPTVKRYIEIDELRLFAEDKGLHAIEDAGTTFWMQWRLGSAPEAEKEAVWKKVHAEVLKYPIMMLDKPGASRFGIQADLPHRKHWTITEYRVGGSLFCWDLQGSNG